MRRLSVLLAAILVPLFYLFYYTPVGMDTTDFGYFYAYAWRILQGETPYRDFFYIKPALPLYWHAFWMWLTPVSWQILGGKAGFCISLLASSWLGALYFRRVFRPGRAGLSLPLLATCGFVFGVHTFPHMPWHTADGVLFCAGALYAGAAGLPALAGILAACGAACKQSFLLVPFALALFILLRYSLRHLIFFLTALLLTLACFFYWIWSQEAWTNFQAMTTGQLDIREALDAGVGIYLRQNWFLPTFALLPLAAALLLKKPLPSLLSPAWVYMFLLTVRYIIEVWRQQAWIGFGLSWPTLFMLLGWAMVVWPISFPYSLLRLPLSHSHRRLTAGVALAVPLIASWSVAISGGYKIPALFALPLLFAFFIFHYRFFGSAWRLSWFCLGCGLVMFWAGYQYPYVFPQRTLSRVDIEYDAGEIYPQARGVKVDGDMYERLLELKNLRARYGSNYKTLPGFPFSYYLNGDKPRLSSDWLIDWEINGKIDQLYQELLDRDLVVFMERDQLNTTRADNYDRAGYGVPQLVVKNWQIVDETPHFVVFRRPSPQLPDSGHK